MTEQILPQWSERLKRFDVSRFHLPIGAQALASWLSDDLGSQSVIQSFIEKFEALDRASSGGYIGSGNAFHVRVANGLIFIESQFIKEQKVLIKIDDAIVLLRAYEHFLDESKRGRDFPPKPLSAKFEMESESALEFYLSTGFPLGLTKNSQLCHPCID